MIELSLLAHPEDSQGQEAQQVHHEARRESGQGPPKVMLAMNRLGHGDVEVEDQQGHGHGKNAIAHGGEPLRTLAGD